MAFFMPTLIFGAQFNPYPVRMAVLGAYKTVIVNRPALISYTLPRAPQSQRVVIVQPPLSSRIRYYVYDPFAPFIGPYPVVLEGGHRICYLTSQQAYPWIQNELIGPVDFYTLPMARRQRVYQFTGRRVIPTAPATVTTPVPNQTAVINTPFTYTIPLTMLTNTEDPGATYVWKVTLSDGTPLPIQGINFNPVTRVLSGTPIAPGGVKNLKVTAIDKYNRAVTDDFTLTIGP